ncbi:hypothetical protein [Amycolatopsis speibonae]|uniref:Antibiotic biosynthesis monooxygenase n=1 Tax=Amycolatopsis speibonae TaxID=1450224 RepID=A0ABV7P8K8_9PSEU
MNFVAATVLRGRGRGGLVCYSQWTRPSDAGPDGSPPLVVPKRWSLRDCLPEFVLLESRTYKVVFVERSDGVDKPTEVSADATPLAHFGMFTVSTDKQARMIELARRYAPNSLTTPGLTAIDFHRSLDGTRVVNFGLWTTFDSFDSLLDKDGFENEAPYWTGVADFQPDFFDIATVEAA